MHGIHANPGTEDARQLALLTLPVGQPGSGYKRYAAAMYFYRQGKIRADLLETYRRCCKFDNDDPVAIAVADGITT